ncbi:RsmE family RNA methyltransferase [Bdellovibrionota bacterium FG-1]
MKRLLCPQLPKPNRPSPLAETEAVHAIRVLRLKNGDTVEAIDGQGHSAPAILRIHGGLARLELAATDLYTAQVRTSAPDTIVPLTLELAILKGDAMGWAVEKSVELGVSRLIPTITAHTVVQVKMKGPEAFRERWQKIADQALKQCGRLDRLIIDLPTPLEELIAREPSSTDSPRFWCDEAATDATPDLLSAFRASSAPIHPVRLLIGPEGGWSEQERELLSAAAQRVSLGPLVLRAETAAVFGSSVLVAGLRSANRLTRTGG